MIAMCPFAATQKKKRCVPDHMTFLCGCEATAIRQTNTAKNLFR